MGSAEVKDIEASCETHDDRQDLAFGVPTIRLSTEVSLSIAGPREQDRPSRIL